MITILGPTASGKTRLAVSLARHLGGEIISADSRQVYRGMNLGTGKDLEEYTAGGMSIPIHLIDLRDPGYEYNIYEFRQDFYRVYQEITGRKKVPVLCGGSGMYLETILLGYDLRVASNDQPYISHLESLPDEALGQLVRKLKPLHNKTDLEDRGRMIKAILVSRSDGSLSHFTLPAEQAGFRKQVFGISIPRDQQMRLIEERLEKRLKAGMIDEVRDLLASGISAGQLIRYGLEYRYITLFLTGQMDDETMRQQLNIAIRQFAKRQMTWFRRMERRGVTIHWIDGQQSPEQQLQEVLRQVGPKYYNERRQVC